MSTHISFFTNEPGARLLDRFKKTLQTTQYFDVLVGYFRTTGLRRLRNLIEQIKKIHTEKASRCSIRNDHPYNDIGHYYQDFRTQSWQLRRQLAVRRCIVRIDR